MSRPIFRLAARAVERACRPGKFADGGGLYLVVGDRSKSWVFRWAKDGQERAMGLGPARDVSLADARRRAAEARVSLANGFCPLDVKRRASAERRKVAAPQTASSGPKFADVADDYFERMSPSWRNAKHVAQFKSSLQNHAAALMALPIANVTTEDVVAALRPIWIARSETASRIRGRIERTLDFAKVSGLRTGENPARWVGHLAQILPPRKRLQRGHFAALPWQDMPTVDAKIRRIASMGARALEFLILTASRTSEVLGARWDEIDTTAAIWTVPPVRMKGNREHRVALSGRAVALLLDLKQSARGELVFPSPASAAGSTLMSTMSMSMIIRRLDIRATVHGFRSTFRDWAAETTDFSGDVCEAALAHVVGNRVEAAYRRGDLFEKRRLLMAAWADFCGSTPVDEFSEMLG